MRLLGLFLGLLIFAAKSDTSYGNFSSNYAETRYPVVLVHGMFGFDNILGVMDYFYQIPEALERHGADVYVVRLNGIASTDARNLDLLDQVGRILAKSRKAKVHLFGHSHGSLNARYVASVRPEWVASVVSISGPNQGSRVADLMYDALDRQDPLGSILTKVINGAAELWNQLSKTPHRGQPDILGSLKSLRSSEVARFNQKHPEGLSSMPCVSIPSLAANGVHYFSIGGTRARTHPADLFDGVFAVTSKLAYRNKLQNDGLIDTCSSHLGEVIHDKLPMNHLDTVNLFFGMVDLDPVPIYLSIVNNLKRLGL